MHITVINSVFSRALCVDTHLSRKHTEFFRGWAAADKRITPEQTYVKVDELKARKCLDYDIGYLFGQVQSYQGLIFLNAEFGLSEEMFQTLCHAYE